MMMISIIIRKLAVHAPSDCLPLEGCPESGHLWTRLSTEFARGDDSHDDDEGDDVEDNVMRMMMIMMKAMVMLMILVVGQILLQELKKFIGCDKELARARAEHSF